MRKRAAACLKDPAEIKHWPGLMRGKNAAVESYPDGDQGKDMKDMLSSTDAVAAGLRTLMAEAQRLSASIDKETFGSKDKGKAGTEGLGRRPTSRTARA